MSTTTLSLGPQERMRLLRLLPQENMGLAEARATRRLRDKIFSEEEKEDIGFNPNTGQIEDIEAFLDLPEREIGITETQSNVIIEAIVKLDDEERFPNDAPFWTFVEAFEDEIKRRIDD